MFKLLKNATVYAPEKLGVRDVLFAGERIVQIAERIEAHPAYGEIEVIDCTGCSLVPGFVDQHVHLIGGGGEGSFSTRTPEVMLSDLTSCGITTVVGTLGTDSVTRHMTSLLAKAKGLEEEGISTWIYTGAYDVPVPTLTGSVRTDLIIVDKVVGVGEVAMSDHRSSQPTRLDFAQLAAQARVGGMLSGKAGVLHIHLGDGKAMIDWVFDLLKETELPITQFTPTHFNKNKTLFMEGVRFAKAGGMVDITTSSSTISPGRIQPPEALKICVEEGVPLDRVTMSSDGNGSLPVFDAAGKLMGLVAASPASLHKAVRDIVQAGILPLEDALRPVTCNPARSLKLPRKGALKVGFDADAVVLDADLKVRDVFAKGRTRVREATVVVKGVFEK